jgi:hypothetical protein
MTRKAKIVVTKSSENFSRWYISVPTPYGGFAPVFGGDKLSEEERKTRVKELDQGMLTIGASSSAAAPAVGSGTIGTIAPFHR